MTTREGKALKFVSVPIDYAAGIQEGDATPVYITPAPGGTGGTVQNANLSIQATDEGSIAGNSRAANTVDLQTTRNSITQVASGVGSVVSGGFSNTASGVQSFVGGGDTNTASGALSAVSGGGSNLASGDESTVSGGGSNTASGESATVSGGNTNTAAGDYSHASGRNMQIDAAADRTQAHGYAAAAVPIVRPDSFYIHGLQLFFAMEQAAPTDASLVENGSGTFWFDNATSELRVKVRNEAGTVLNGVVATLV